MDYDSTILILKLVSEVFGALKEVDVLVKRVEAGDVITNEDIEKARADVKAAVDRWKNPEDVA